MTLKNKVLKLSKEGYIVFNTGFGLDAEKLDEFIQQPVDGILYDLNRNESTILTLVNNDEKWVNDYAVAKVIRALKAKIDELESKVK